MRYHSVVMLATTFAKIFWKIRYDLKTLSIKYPYFGHACSIGMLYNTISSVGVCIVCETVLTCVSISYVCAHTISWENYAVPLRVISQGRIICVSGCVHGVGWGREDIDGKNRFCFVLFSCLRRWRWW